MTPYELNKIANEIFLSNFNIPFTGWVEWSTKMKNIVGNCRNDGRIALNKKYYEKYGKTEIIRVLRHELAHLYCFTTIGAHNHSNPIFKETLTKLGGTKYGKAMPFKIYIYECPNCKKQWKFKHKINKSLCCAKCCNNGLYNKNYKIKYIQEEIYEPYN